MTRLRLALVAAAFLGAGLPVAALPATPACAGETARAVLVVDTGEGGTVLRFCVSLPKSQVSGIELIRLAHAQHGLDYRLGFGGGAVCRLAGVGPDSEDCFAEHPNFWGYWRGTPGGWTWSSTGAGSTVVRDGSVEGWSWGSGQDGNSHPKPPPTSFGSVCPPQAKPPEPSSRGSGSSTGGDGAGGVDGSGSSSRSAPTEAAEPAERERSKTARPSQKDEKQRAERGRIRPVRATEESPRPTPDQTETTAPTAAPAMDGTGPPIAGIAGLTGAGMLLVGAAVVGRRRRRSGTG